MKKKILKATIVASFALIAGMNVYNAQKSDVMSELALANVEALASVVSETGFLIDGGLRDAGNTGLPGQ